MNKLDPRLSWLGLGAQRSGTTWFTSLLVEHPEVSVAADGRKEQHALYGGLLRPWTEQDTREYLGRFPAGLHVGDFTPYHLRAPWMVDIVDAVTQPGAPLVVLLRDPVARFESALRLYLQRGQLSPDDVDLGRLRGLAGDAVWAGMYAEQLEGWETAVGPDRLVVLQYERVRANPIPAVHAVWDRIGVEPVSLAGVSRPSETSTTGSEWSFDGAGRLREQLVALYAGQGERLARWGVDASLWTS